MSHGRHDAVQHINDDHADDLLTIGRAFGGHADATAARAERVDRDGIDLVLDTPRGPAAVHVAFTEPAVDPDRLRVAFVHLARRARAALAANGNQSTAS